jgi:hypothetical protein
MGWGAILLDDRGDVDGDWNYTHNTSPMIYAVLEEAGGELHGSVSWWQHLNGMSGSDGAALLHEIIVRLEADPERFTAMNPENGWGSYDGLVRVLREMRVAVPEWPTTWACTG